MTTSRTKHIVRRVTSVVALLIAVIGVLFGDPQARVFWLVVGVLVVVWDIIATAKPNHTNSLQHKDNPEKSTVSETSYILTDIEKNESQSKTIVFTTPKRKVMVILVIILIIVAYSIGYSTGKNTAVRIDKETQQSNR